MRTASFLGAASNARAHHWNASAFEPEPLLADLARLGEELQPLGQRRAVARRRRAQQHLVGGEQPRPLLRRAVERQQRQRRAAVARIGRQDALVGLERALRLVQLLLGDQRDPLEQARARRHVGGAIGQRRQLIAQVAERAVLGVQRLERRVVARLRVDLAQRARRARVLGLQLLDALEDLDRRLRRAQPFVQQRAAPLEQRQLAGASFGGVRVQPLALEDLDQRRPAPLAIVQRRQPRQRVGVALADLLRQHLVVERDRLAHVVQAIAREARHLDQARPARRRVEVRQLLR